MAIDGESRTMWIFEPRVAERVFETMILENQIPVIRNQWLNRTSGVKKNGASIEEITTLSGSSFRAKMFIDATYEGDLMAAAGITYRVGRESSAEFGEPLNGNIPQHARSHQFLHDVDPYVIPGDPQSGLLPRIDAGPIGSQGQADHRVQAYCYRMCLTNHPENRVPFPKPVGYDPQQYDLLLRYIQAGWNSKGIRAKFDPIPNCKTDTNNHGGFSFDNIGMNYQYPEASYEERQRILEEHRTYQQGLLYFLANDPAVPATIREDISEWGLPRDEFVDNGHWPHQIYVREARRMVSDFVMTEHHTFGRKAVPKSVGLGSYGTDVHEIRRIVKDGVVIREGKIATGRDGAPPYAVGYDALVPKRSECENLFVTFALSSSHVAFASIRMEPVFMGTSQSAAAAAVIAMDADQAVQDVDYEALKTVLIQHKQVLAWPPQES
jgi:hypothetical protein